MKKMRIPDLKAPRFKQSYTSIVNKDTIAEFNRRYPEYGNLTYSEFKNIISTYNGLLVKGIIDNRNGVELPDGLGYIFLGTCPKAKKQNIDYRSSIENGFVTEHKNWDSDNKLLKIFYSNYEAKYPFKHKDVWTFTAVRQFKREASKAYKENWAKYIEVSPKKKISKMYDRYRKKEYVKNLKPIVPEDYDEFKLD